MRRIGQMLALCVVLALVAVANATAGGGNSANAKLCQKGGWTSLLRSDGTSFASEEACVSYAAQGGTLTPKSKSQLDCEAFGGTFSTDPATNQVFGGVITVLWTCNGSPLPDQATADAWSDALLNDCRADNSGVLQAGHYGEISQVGGTGSATCLPASV